MKSSTLVIGIILLSFLFNSCGDEGTGDNPEVADSDADLAEQVEAHNQNEEFEEALDLLRQADEDDPEVQQMLETIHMNYALYLTYEAGQDNMRKNMPKALEHYRRVKEINPDHERAQEEIDQIEEIYQQLGRDIPEGVAE